ncbi:MAG: phosphotransferase [Pseudomonadota bacterium]
MTGVAAAAPDRHHLRNAFLATHGWTENQAAPLAGDASNRCYFRLIGADRIGAVLMDAPPDRGEDIGPFIDATTWLRRRGLSAPAILAADHGAGFLLLEDLGDDLFARVVAHTPAVEPELYGAAVDLLADLAAEEPPARDSFPPYDLATLLREAGLATEWWLQAATERSDPEIDVTHRSIAAAALAHLADCREAVVLRDYHAENLIWLPDRQGAARVGLLDYQDALIGHPAYDLVSLLEDARRDTAPALQSAMLARYLDRRGLGGTEAEAFRASYATLGAQRNLKIIGIFARLAIRDGKPRYLSMIPRVWGHLQRDLAHPALADWARWVTHHLPAPEPSVLTRVAAQADGQGQAP